MLNHLDQIPGYCGFYYGWDLGVGELMGRLVVTRISCQICTEGEVYDYNLKHIWLILVQQSFATRESLWGMILNIEFASMVRSGVGIPR